MIVSKLVAVLILFVFLFMPITAQGFECPKHFKEAQAAIDKVAGEMGGDMAKKLKKEDMALVHALLDDAKMYLEGAKHNHEKPQGAYDHARAIAKADAAKGYAMAADAFHWRLMKKK